MLLEDEGGAVSSARNALVQMGLACLPLSLGLAVLWKEGWPVRSLLIVLDVFFALHFVVAILARRLVASGSRLLRYWFIATSIVWLGGGLAACVVGISHGEILKSLAVAAMCGGWWSKYRAATDRLLTRT